MNRWRTLARSTNKDRDHDEVVKALRASGASVFETFKPLDLVVGYRGVTLLVEIKRPMGKRGGGDAKHGQTLSPAQAKFINEWRGARPLIVTLGTCVADVCAAVGGADA